MKGCLARDAFVRMAGDVGKLAPAIQANAAQELGLDPHQVGSGLMREYLEKRCPLGDQRLLTQMGYILSAAWEHGYKTQNQDLMGHAARALVFIDQTAIDNGRTNLSWLLTGLPEPQYTIVQRNKVRTSLAPFTRLAPAAWVSANVAYMKDLDFLQTKIRAANLGKNLSTPGATDDPGEGDAADPSRKNPWKKKKKKWTKEDPGTGSSTGA